MLLADKILFDDDYVLMHLYESIFSNVGPIREGAVESSQSVHTLRKVGPKRTKAYKGK